MQAADIGAYAAFQQYALTLSVTTAKVRDRIAVEMLANEVNFVTDSSRILLRPSRHFTIGTLNRLRWITQQKPLRFRNFTSWF